METTTAKILIIRFAGRFDSSALFIVLIMVKYNCCVPNCADSWRNSPGLKFHTIPKDKEIRKETDLSRKSRSNHGGRLALTV